MLLCSNSIASIEIHFPLQIARGAIKYLDTYVCRNLLLDIVVSIYKRSAVNFGDWIYAIFNFFKKEKLISNINAVEYSILFKLTF